jgi:hypothetical protein
LDVVGGIKIFTIFVFNCLKAVALTGVILLLSDEKKNQLCYPGVRIFPFVAEYVQSHLNNDESLMFDNLIAGDKTWQPNFPSFNQDEIFLMIGIWLMEDIAAFR